MLRERERLWSRRERKNTNKDQETEERKGEKRSWSIKEDREKPWEVKGKEVEADIMRQMEMERYWKRKMRNER